jgi:hypothetical protein
VGYYSASSGNSQKSACLEYFAWNHAKDTKFSLPMHALVSYRSISGAKMLRISKVSEFATVYINIKFWWRRQRVTSSTAFRNSLQSL